MRISKNLFYMYPYDDICFNILKTQKGYTYTSSLKLVTNGEASLSCESLYLYDFNKFINKNEIEPSPVKLVLFNY